jgi:hypothetical protein
MSQRDLNRKRRAAWLAFLLLYGSISILLLTAMFLKVLSNFCRYLIISHLVHCFNADDASTKFVSLETLFQLILSLTRAKYQNRYCITIDGAQGRAGQVDNLVLVVKHALLGVFNVILITLGFKIHLGVLTCIQFVAFDYLLRLRVHHDLSDIDPIHPIDDRDNPIEARIGKTPVLSQPLDQSPARWPHHTNTGQEEHEDVNNACRDPIIDNLLFWQ